MIEKDKYKLTVCRVFLLICILLICLLGYLLVVEHDKVNSLSDKNTEITFTESDALKIINEKYQDAYEYVNNSMFFNNDSLDAGCLQLDTKGLSKYFTERVINDFKDMMLTNDEIYYDCEEVLNALELASIFGTTDQGQRELEVVTFNEEVIVAKGKLTTNFDKERYIILVKQDNSWLIDLYE